MEKKKLKRREYSRPQKDRKQQGSNWRVSLTTTSSVTKDALGNGARAYLLVPVALSGLFSRGSALPMATKTASERH